MNTKDSDMSKISDAASTLIAYHLAGFDREGLPPERCRESAHYRLLEQLSETYEAELRQAASAREAAQP